MQVRATLLNASCAVSDQPEVCECVRSDSDLALLGLNCATNSLHSSRPARSLATSMKKFIPMPQKNDSRGAKESMPSSASKPALRSEERRVGKECRSRCSPTDYKRTA